LASVNGDHLPLRGAKLAARYASIFDDADLEQTRNQAQDALVPDTVLEETDDPCVGHAGRQAAFWMRQALREQPSTAWVNRTLSVTYARLGERLAALGSLKALHAGGGDLSLSDRSSRRYACD
jgi:hypothetical protein